MSPEYVVGFAKQALEATLLVSAPMLGFGLVVGLLVSVFQAVTSIQEMTLTFIPKILAVFLALIIFFPWMLRYLVDFTVRLMVSIPSVIG
ncbi:MAG: flagellar biosynthetic protein FliQ [Deltaproteobacteria bacterium]|nr:MAG: flagellar biosynthetic protein FliQ [Deltaproteobacteria bacterium]